MGDDGRRWRGWWWKRYGRRVVIVGPLLCRWKPQVMLDVKPRRYRLLGAEWQLDDDDQHTVAIGAWWVMAEVTLHERAEPAPDGEDNTDAPEGGRDG